MGVVDDESLILLIAYSLRRGIMASCTSLRGSCRLLHGVGAILFFSARSLFAYIKEKGDFCKQQRFPFFDTIVCFNLRELDPAFFVQPGSTEG